MSSVPSTPAIPNSYTSNPLAQPAGHRLTTCSQAILRGILESGVSHNIIALDCPYWPELRSLLQSHNATVTSTKSEPKSRKRKPTQEPNHPKIPALPFESTRSTLIGHRSLTSMKQLPIILCDNKTLSHWAHLFTQPQAAIWIVSRMLDDASVSASYPRPAFINEVIEPATLQEAKDWTTQALQHASQHTQQTVIKLAPTLAAHGGTIACNPYPKTKSKTKPETRRQRKGQSTNNRNQTLAWPRKDENVDIGIIAVGHAYAPLMTALNEANLTPPPPVMRIGQTYPLPTDELKQALTDCHQLIVVEEAPHMIETTLRTLQTQVATEEATPNEEEEQTTPICKIHGHQLFADNHFNQAYQPHNIANLIDRILPLLTESTDRSTINRYSPFDLATEQANIATCKAIQPVLNPRTPTFQPGCPLRDIASTLQTVRARLKDSQVMLKDHSLRPIQFGVGLDPNFESLFNQPPFDRLTQPNENEAPHYQVDLLDINTFVAGDHQLLLDALHSSAPSQSDQSHHANGSNRTNPPRLLLLTHLDPYNINTPAYPLCPDLESSDSRQSHDPPNIYKYAAQVIRNILPARQRSSIETIIADTSDRQRFRRLIERLIIDGETAVVIATKTQDVDFYRQQIRAEREELASAGYILSKPYLHVAQEVCEFGEEVPETIGDPRISIRDTDFGLKYSIDHSIEVDDQLPANIQLTPAFEQVTVQRLQPVTPYELRYLTETLPEPGHPLHADQDHWRCFIAGITGSGQGLTARILALAGQLMGYHIAWLDRNNQPSFGAPGHHQLVYARSQAAANKPSNPSNLTGIFEPTPVAPSTVSPTNTGLDHTYHALIPWGRCDLLLGLDPLEAARAISWNHGQAVASTNITAGIINTDITYPMPVICRRETYRAKAVRDTLANHLSPDDSRFDAFDQLADRLFSHSRFRELIMLGAAYQKRLLPLRANVIHKAIDLWCNETRDPEPARCWRAFQIGRTLIERPEPFDALLNPAHKSESTRKSIRRRGEAIRIWTGPRKGRQRSRQYQERAHQFVTQQPTLPKPLQRDAVIRAADCMLWDDFEYTDQYFTTLEPLIQQDTALHEQDQIDQNYRLSRAAIWNLARVMLIKDEFYVATLLTHPEKYRRDRKEFNIDRGKGDRLVYRHQTQPEFAIAGRYFRFEWNTTPRQLRTMARLKWMRKVLRRWGRRQRYFRDWYIETMTRVVNEAAALTTASDTDQLTDDTNLAENYTRWVAILSVPERVSGYREIRWPKLQSARRRGEQLLAMTPAEYHEEQAMRRAVRGQNV